MCELNIVFKIINVCAERVLILRDVYYEGFLGLLKLFALPFIKNVCSDEIKYKNIAVDFISQLGNNVLIIFISKIRKFAEHK